MTTKSEEEFQYKCEAILENLEPNQTNWVPFKVKRQVVDAVKEVIKGPPKDYGAHEKLNALRLLNKSILLRNNEFNRYVENILMAGLQRLAQFNAPKQADDAASDAGSAKLSAHDTAQEMLRRGEMIFGPHETDRQSSATFLVILLDSIEKWSRIDTSDSPSLSNAQGKPPKATPSGQRSSGTSDSTEEKTCL